MDLKTFKDLIGSRGDGQRLVTVAPHQTVGDAIALMKKYDIENIPVMEGSASSGFTPVGSISETGLFFKLVQQPDIRNQPVGAVMEAPYPVVSFDTPVERLSTLISKDNGAVLSKDDSGAYHIVTKYDVLQSLSK